MEAKKIQNVIDIDAPRADVWKVLIEDQYQRDWYAPFGEGVYAISDWSVGSKAIFSGADNNGLIGKVTAADPGRLLEIEYTGIYSRGEEDYDSEIACAVKGGKEVYRLEENRGHTILHTSADMSADMYASMSEAWNAALTRIKQLSESISTEATA